MGAKRKGSPSKHVSKMRVSPWLIATPIVAIAAAILAALVLTSGSSGTTGPAAESTPDQRVAERIPQR